MERPIGIIREFRTTNFTVIADALPEDDLDLSFEEDGTVAEGLDSGEFIAFTARVRVFFHGEVIGSDYLGGCIYRSLEEFADHRACGRQNRRYEAEGISGRFYSYFSQMISEAISEARKHLASIKATHLRTVRG